MFGNIWLVLPSNTGQKRTFGSKNQKNVPTRALWSAEKAQRSKQGPCGQGKKDFGTGKVLHGATENTGRGRGRGRGRGLSGGARANNSASLQRAESKLSTAALSVRTRVQHHKRRAGGEASTNVRWSVRLLCSRVCERACEEDRVLATDSCQS